MIEFTDIGDTKVFIRLDRIESIQDTDNVLITIRMMSGVEHKMTGAEFDSVRQRILDYWASLPIVNPGQEKG